MAKLPVSLRVKDLVKTYGSVVALNGISFELEPGEVLGVVGQRGSGKSTLFRVLGGAEKITSGEILLNDKPVHLRNSTVAKSYGIEAVYQNHPLMENLEVWKNIFIGTELSRYEPLAFFPKDGEMSSIARDYFKKFDLSPDLVNSLPRNLSNEQRQVVALAKALNHDSRLLLLDDALAPLSFQRQGILLDEIIKLSAQNVSVVISSDDLKQIFTVSHRILVLFDGHQASLQLTSQTTPREIVELIVGSNKQDHITPVIWAFENYHTAQQQAEDLRKNQQALQQTLKKQDTLNQQLFSRLGKQMEALDQLNLALQEANRRLMTEREAERKALARDLHDQVIQDLLSFNYQLEDAALEFENQELRGELGEIRAGIKEVVSSLRQICSDLRPPTIDSQGLPAAIRSLTHQWANQYNVKVTLELDPDLGRLPETIELSVFRIIQEGLRNVRKHAEARNVHLTLSRTPTASLVVHLRDDGRGLQTPINFLTLSEGKHFGLLGISERVSLLNGTIHVDSPTEGGLDLLIEIPSPYPVFSN